MILITKTSDQTRQRGVCVCVYCLLICSGRQACGRTSRSHTGFLTHLPSAVLALNFLARGGFSRSFPCLPAVESNYVY